MNEFVGGAMFRRIIYGIVLLGVLASCSEYAGIRRMRITPCSAEVAIGETIRVDYSIEPEDATHDFPYWEISDPTVAKLEDYLTFGYVTGLSEGTCTITAWLGRKRASCEITVYKPYIPVSKVILSEEKFDIKKTDTRRLEAIIVPYNADEQTVTWASENTSVATVDGAGLVTAVSAGSTRIIAQCGEASASCEVNVWERSGIIVECVDLGLSVDWCTTDLGAASPEARGDYYAWGEVKTKTFFDWSNYAHYDETYRDLTKYNSDRNLGYQDGKSQLELTDDVAYRLIDDDYRIPTSAQWVELLEHCNWEETKLNDTRGYKVSSKDHPERWIFLPYGDSVSGVIPNTIPDFRGMYWTATRVTNTGMSNFAWAVMFYYSKIDRVDAERCDGMRIRPVRLKSSSP